MTPPEIIGASFFDFHQLIESLTAGRISGRWLIFGLAAQTVIFGCLVAHWVVSKKHGRIIIRRSVVYVGLITTVMLLVYASMRHDLVYVVGQLLNVVIGLRLLELIHRTSQRQTKEGLNNFPVVKPDSAERTLPSAKK